MKVVFRAKYRCGGTCQKQYVLDEDGVERIAIVANDVDGEEEYCSTWLQARVLFSFLPPSLGCNLFNKLFLSFILL